MATKSHQEPSEPSLKYQTWVLKVSLHCDGCKREVKKVLKSIDGVFTTKFDSQQHKVTVTGNVPVETLIKKLVKTGKHAEIWPEKLAAKEKKSGKPKNKDKENDPESAINYSEENVENPENNEDSPAVDHKGGETEGGAAKSGGKKKKRRGQKGNNGSSGLGSPLLGEPACRGSQSQALGMDHGVGPKNLIPTCQQFYLYPQGNHPLPVYVTSYNRTYPGHNFDPPYSVPSSHYTCIGTHQQLQGIPLDSFEIFSDENANGCSIM